MALRNVVFLLLTIFICLSTQESWRRSRHSRPGDVTKKPAETGRTVRHHKNHSESTQYGRITTFVYGWFRTSSTTTNKYQNMNLSSVSQKFGIYDFCNYVIDHNGEKKRECHHKRKFTTTTPSTTKLFGSREVYKPAELPQIIANRHKKPYSDAWMDYCDPYHCNDYHKLACGLHRKKMKFRWFQSGCHLTLHNKCASYRGFLKYDMIETKWCTQYVLFLRKGCPVQCGDDYHPICAKSSYDNHIVLFKNICEMDYINCGGATLMEYDEVSMSNCVFHLLSKIKNNTDLINKK